MHAEAAPIFPYSFSLNFPIDQKNELFREHIISTIEKQFELGKSILCIEGEEGIGKTTILKQFTQAHKESSFASFINPVRGLAAPEDFVLHDLYDQLNWFATSSDRGSQLNIDEEKYLSIRYLAKRELKKRKKSISYFIIDGLEFIQDDDTLKKILKLIPIGEPGVKVLVSIEAAKMHSLITSSSPIPIYSIPLFPFSLDEAKKAFNIDFPVEENEIRLIWEAANKGVPGKLRDIYRILQDNNITVQDFLDDLDQISILYEIDWRKLNSINDDLLNKISSFVALDDKIYTVNSISSVLNVNETDVTNSIKRVSFLSILPNGEIHFTSNSSRAFFSKRLSEYKKFVISANVDHLLKNQDSLEALISLPKYYSSSSDYDGVLNVLSKDYFPKLIKTSQTLTAASTSLKIGFSAAKKSGADLKLFDFSLYGSLIANVEGLHIWESEIEARIEMGDYDNAIRLANSALLQEDRLANLVKIAKIKKRKKEAIEPALLDQIDHLYKAIDVKSLGEKAVKIAADLFYVNPSLALSLIHETSNSDGQNINKWLLGKLTLAALDAKQSGEYEKISELTTNQRAKEFAASLSEIFGSYSFEEIVAEVNKLGAAREKILLFRLWLVNNKENKNLPAAINYTLDMMVENNSKDFAESALLSDLIEEVYKFEEPNVTQEILGKALKFKDECKRLNYSVDYFKFMTHVIRAKVKNDHDAAMGLFYDLKKELDMISDKVSKAECLAILDNCLFEIKKNLDTKRHGFLFETLKSQLKNLVTEIYENSAYHYENLKDVLWLLAKFNCEFAIEMSLKANTIDRRDGLLFKVFDGYITQNLASLNPSIISGIYNNINDDGVKELCLRSVLEEVVNEKQLLDKKIIGFIFNKLPDVKSLHLQIYLQCLMVSYLNGGTEKDKDKLLDSLYTSISKNWSALDSETTRIETGYLIASTLSQVNKEIAMEYLVRADGIRMSIWPDSINTIAIYTIYAHLMIRAFSGLIKRRQYHEKTFLQVVETIGAIPSPITKIELWGYFWSIAHVKGDLNLRSKLFDELIKPTYDTIADKNLQIQVFINFSFIFFQHYQLQTLRSIMALPVGQREEAIITIIRFLLYHSIPNEPYDRDDRSFRDKLSYEDLNSIIELVENLEIDANIYRFIEAVVQATMEIKASTIQKETIREKLLKIVVHKLPSRNYIKHTGFKIISQAQILKFEKDSKKQSATFDELLHEIENSVANISDRAFIYATLSEIVPYLKGLKYTQTNFVGRSLTIIDKLDFSLESVYRTEFLLKRLHEVNPNLWKERLTKEFKKTLISYHGSEALNLQRRMIDHAYRHDSIFAKSLIDLLDNEEVRIEYRRKKHLSNHYESLNLKKQIIDDKLIEGKSSASLFAKACNSSLAALNSSKIPAKKTGHIRYFLDYAIKLPVEEGYPIFSYYIQNIIRKQEDTSEAASTFTPIVEAIYGVCKFIEVIVQKYKVQSESSHSQIDLSSARKKLFKAGERELALSFIRNWLSNNDFSYIKICDPYFSANDLEFVKTTLIEVSTKVDIYILTSGDGDGNLDPDVYKTYLTSWRSSCDFDPPFIKISIVRVRRTGKSPFHDRWILVDKAGLHLGTSINGLGVSKSSQITELSLDDKSLIEKDVFNSLFEGREFSGEKIEYFSFIIS